MPPILLIGWGRVGWSYAGRQERVVFRFLDFELDAGLCELRQDGAVLTGDRRILDLLLYLIRNRDRVVPRAELLSEVWGGAPVSERSLHQALYAARKLLGDDVREPRVLATLRARGVRFIADVVELTRRRGPAAAPLPGVGPFVGREDALAELQEALEGAQEGHGGLVLLSGEPGIGKSRLCEKFAERAAQQGARVHVGRCLDTEGAPAFRPWIQLLRSHVERVGAEVWIAQAEEWPDVAQIAPELSPGGPRPRTYSELDVGPVRFRVFDGVSRFWMEIARESPRLLVLEDVQFADESTWQLLRFMARDAAEGHILLLVTYRDSEIQALPRRGEEVGEMLREPGTRALQLTGFSAEEVGEYLELVLDRPVAADVCELLRQRCAGNPFFLSHLAPLLGSDEEERNVSPRASLPTSLRDAIKFQLAALPDSVRTLLEAAAVGGADVALEVLANATDRDRDGLLADLHPALASGVVRQDREREGVLRFAHSLVAEALYESLSDSERKRWHHHLARAIERIYKANLGPHLAQLAHHYVLSVDNGDTEKTILYCMRAGLAACDQFAFDEAIPLLQRALELAEQRGADATKLCDILLPLGEAQTRVGDRSAARETFRRAADLVSSIGAADRLAEVALALIPGFLMIEAGVFDAYVVSMLETALRDLGPNDPALRAKLLSRLACALCWKSGTQQRRTSLVKEAKKIARDLKDPGVSAFVGVTSIEATWSPDHVEARHQLSAQALDLADISGQQELSLLARVFVIATQLERGRLDEYARDARVLRQLTNERRIPHARWYPALYSANLALQSGRLDEAEAYANEMWSLGKRLGDVNIDHSFATIVGLIRLHQGRYREVLNSIDKLANDFPSLPAWRIVHTLLLAFVGDHERAAIQYKNLFYRLAFLERDTVWLASVTLLAEVCVELGDSRRCGEFRKLLEKYSNRVVAVGHGMVCWGSVSRVLGRLAVVAGDYREARESLIRAIDVETRAGLWVWLPYSQAELADLILREGRSSETGTAITLLKSCSAAIERIGIAFLKDRVSRSKEVASQRLL